MVAFYLIAQMVGAGKLIQTLFGLDYLYAVIVVGLLMIVYVAFGGMVATTWVQIIKACLLLGGATFMALMVLAQFGFSPEAMFQKATEVHPGGSAIMAPGHARQRPDIDHLAGACAHVRHGRPAAHSDALLHRLRRQGRA